MTTARLDLRRAPARRALVQDNRAAVAAAASRGGAADVVLVVRCDDHLAQRVVWEVARIALGPSDSTLTALRVGDSPGSAVGSLDARIASEALARAGAGAEVLRQLRAGPDWGQTLVVAVADGGASVEEIATDDFGGGP